MCEVSFQYFQAVIRPFFNPPDSKEQNFRWFSKPSAVKDPSNLVSEDFFAFFLLLENFEKKTAGQKHPEHHPVRECFCPAHVALRGRLQLVLTELRGIMGAHALLQPVASACFA